MLWRMHYPADSSINWVIYSGMCYHLKCCRLFVVLKPSLQASLGHALARSRQSLQPHTRKQYERQFRLYLAFVISRGLTVLDQVTSVLFLEFLATNALSQRVIVNYVSALKFAFDSYGWCTTVFESPLIRRMLRGIKFSISKQPSPKVSSRFTRFVISPYCVTHSITLLLIGWHSCWGFMGSCVYPMWPLHLPNPSPPINTFKDKMWSWLPLACILT